MKRRVIKQGHNTLTITLPSRWVEENRISPGDELDINESEFGLVVTSKGETTKRVLNLDLKDMSYRIIEGHLVIAYKAGYDEIEILFGDTKTFDLIQNIIKTRLLGYEIIEQHKNSCIVKNVSNIIESEFHTILRRIFLIVLSSAKTSLERIKEKDVASLGELLVMKETADKFYSLCCRIIINNHILPSTKNHFIYVILWVLDKLGDDYRDLCVYLIERKNSPLSISHETIKIYESVNALVESFYKTYYSYNPEDMSKVYEERERLIKKIRSMHPTKNETEQVVLEYLLSITKRMDDFIGSTIGLNIK